MALRLGTENKRQVYMVIGLFGLIAVLGVREIYSGMGTSSTPSSVSSDGVTAQRTSYSSNAHTGGASAVTGAHNSKEAIAQKLGNDGIDVTMHLEALAQSEQVDYSGTGRNIFSPESVPVKIDTPIAPPRPAEAVVVAPPAPVKPAAIELKYLGYSQTEDKVLQAVLVHGEDIFMAKTGDIVSHRYKVGAIQAVSVQVTDLTRNYTQTIAAPPN